MRIASWNCRMAFWNKWHYLDAFEPDIMVVPEGASPRRQPAELLERYPHALWVGDRDVQGLLVLATERHPIRLLAEPSTEHRHVLPIAVEGPEPLTLLAVWAQRDRAGKYTDHVLAALHEYEHLLTGNTVIIGDFNSNAIWDDQLDRSATHSDIVGWLGARGFVSGYHRFTGEAQGRETRPTYAQHKYRDRLYHIDHCFMPTSMADGGLSVVVAPVDSWVEISDHGPLVVDVRPLEG